MFLHLEVLTIRSNPLRLFSIEVCACYPGHTISIHRSFPPALVGRAGRAALVGRAGRAALVGRAGSPSMRRWDRSPGCGPGVDATDSGG